MPPTKNGMPRAVGLARWNQRSELDIQIKIEEYSVAAKRVINAPKMSKHAAIVERMR